MSQSKNIINLIKKLAEEAKAVNPIVKKASQAGGSLLKEGQLAQGQKIVQKLPTAEEYSQKMSALKKAAGVAGTVGATSLISQEDANAAGITTIMKKLGGTKEVAQEIKTMAKNVPPDVFEQNIKAIQDVAKYKKDPKGMPELGRGEDVIAHDAGDNVIKVPKRGKLKAWNSERMNIIPSVVEESGLGAKTKTIKTSGNKYQVQEKLSPLGNLSATDSRFSDDQILNQLKDRELELMYNDKGQRRKLTDEDSAELFQIRKDYSTREQDIFKDLNIPEEILDKKLDLNSVNADELEYYLEKELYKKGVSSVVAPSDLHADNVGLDKKNQMKILDTGNFMSLDKSKMTPAMRKKAIENYIALPEEKARFVESLNSQPSSMKKAAAVAPIAMGGEFGQDESQPIPEKTMMDRAKEIGISALAKGVNAYENLSPDTKNNISAGLNVLSQPGAALRGATYAAQTGQPILEGTKKAWDDPETAPTGEQIAEATNLDDSNVLGKTAIATAAEFADPIDWVGLGAASKAAKLKVLGKLK